MPSPEVSGYAALGIGGFQLLANGASLFRGLGRLPSELVREGATTRIADLLQTAWVYGTLGNLCLSVLLLVMASPLRAGEPLARNLATVIGVYYIILGPAAYLFSPVRHVGILVFSALGLVLVAALWLSTYGP
jgi:hypothetical protein